MTHGSKSLSSKYIMNTLIENVLQWGKDKGIIGPKGKGTIEGQIKKSSEEFTETLIAAAQLQVVNDLLLQTSLRSLDDTFSDLLEKTKDGIGDATVTLILLAELSGLKFEDCLQTAYDEIKGRTGTMRDGIFVKDSPSIDDDLGELDPSAACKLSDESCESCQ